MCSAGFDNCCLKLCLRAVCLAGQWQGQQVAIKVLSYQQSSARAFEAFSECLVSQRLHHSNVVCALNPFMSLANPKNCDSHDNECKIRQGWISVHYKHDLKAGYNYHRKICAESRLQHGAGEDAQSVNHAALGIKADQSCIWRPARPFHFEIGASLLVCISFLLLGS